MLVEAEHVELGALTLAARHNGLALGVHVHHQLRRLLKGVAEQLLQDERHIRHEVDRVVPHDHLPGAVVAGRVLVDGLVDALTDLVGGGSIWLLTPKVGRPGTVDAADVAEAAPIAGLSQTTTAAVSKDWQATRLVAPKTVV